MNSPSHTQLLVIGAGPGGYPAAFHAADLGLSVTLIDLYASPGGICLHSGCIPSKALLHAAQILSDVRAASEFGIEFGNPQINIPKLRAWKDGLLRKLTGGLGQLTAQRKITFIQGQASFLDSRTVKVRRKDGTEDHLTFDQAIIASGSRPNTLARLPASDRILDSTSALKLDAIPETMLIVGGGYIGLELGTVYARFGSRVDVVEMLPRLVTGADPDLVQIAQRGFKSLFNRIDLETKVTSVTESSNDLQVTLTGPDGSSTDRAYEKILVAVGRRPNTDMLDLHRTRVTTDPKGFIQVNPQRRTNDPAIFAVGDLTGEPMLAHKATHEGIVAAEAAAGKQSSFAPKAIPCVIFTDPEIAWCGLTEAEANQSKRGVMIAKFPWGASGRALSLGNPDGLTKLIIDKETEEILGVGIVGQGAGDLIAEGVLAVETRATAANLKHCVHPHPTLSETLMECAQQFFGQTTHLYRTKK